MLLAILHSDVEVAMKSYFDTNRLYRDNIRRKISGVCAGVANHFEQPVWAVRVLAIVAFFFAPVPVAIAYALAVLLIPTK